MRKVMIFLQTMLLVLIFASISSATVLNFDDLVGGTNIKDTYYQGVFFTSPDAQTVTVFVDNNFGAGSSSLHNSIAADGGTVGMGTLKAIFPSLVSFVEITGGDSGGDLDSFGIEVYDSLDTLLASASSGVFGGNLNHTDGYYGDSVTLSVSAANISYALFIPTSSSEFGITWDDLTYTSVPEPATIVLLGFGLAGVGLFRKRFKK